MLNSAAWSPDDAAHAVATRGDTDVVWLSSTDRGASWSAPGVFSGPDAATRTAPFIRVDDRLRLHAVWNSMETGNVEVFYGCADTTGIEEPGTPGLPPVRAVLCPNPTRGMIRLASRSGAVLFDRDGRAVAGLVPGPNNVRHLSPGVYFVHQASGAERDGPNTAKVIVTR